MKKTISIILSAVLTLSLFAGCGKSAVFEKSANADDCTTVLEKDSKYVYRVETAVKTNEMHFTFIDVKETEDTSELDSPKGKWVEADLDLATTKPSDDLLNDFVNNNNILLNDAAPSSCKLKYNDKSEYDKEEGAVFFFAGNYELAVYYDVPEDFNVDTAEVTGSDYILLVK